MGSHVKKQELSFYSCKLHKLQRSLPYIAFLIFALSTLDIWAVFLLVYVEYLTFDHPFVYIP